MGMYTELYLGVELSSNTDKIIIDWLEHHNRRDLSDNEYWDLMEKISPLKGRLYSLYQGGSYYFDAQGHFLFKYDEISKTYYLTVGFNIKNYNDEIGQLLRLLEPYITSDGHIGHIRYEESEYPTLLMYEDSKIIYKDK